MIKRAIEAGVLLGVLYAIVASQVAIMSAQPVCRLTAGQCVSTTCDDCVLSNGHCFCVQ